MTRAARFRWLLACLLAVLALPVIRWELELRERHSQPIALCPKIEWRVIKRRGRIVHDTLPIAPCLTADQARTTP